MTQNNTPGDLVEVTQADHKAANLIAGIIGRNLIDMGVPNSVILEPIVQAFARHRIAAQSEHETFCKSWDIRQQIARKDEEIARLRDALGFYSKPYFYRGTSMYMCGHSSPSHVQMDGGAKARDALNQ